MTIIQRPIVPTNYEKGRRGNSVTAIVLHHTTGSAESSYNYFNTIRPGATSAHYIVTKNAEIWQLVQDEDTAWHAGSMDWNLRTIGVECESGEDWDAPDTYPDKQYDAIAWLTCFLVIKFNLEIKRGDGGYIKHGEISGTQCPGILDVDRIMQEAKLYFNDESMINDEQWMDIWELTKRLREDIKNDPNILNVDQFKGWWFGYGKRELSEQLTAISRNDVLVEVVNNTISLEIWYLEYSPKEYSNVWEVKPKMVITTDTKSAISISLDSYTQMINESIDKAIKDDFILFKSKLK